jgi:hypothetical protein
MKKILITSVLSLSLLALIFLPQGSTFAAEIDAVTGNTYLTFISEAPFIDTFSFDDNGNFNMLILESTLPGEGTYTDQDFIFSANWKSDDGDTTYAINGISLIGMVILGTIDRREVDGDDVDNDLLYYVGILGSVIPD